MKYGYLIWFGFDGNSGWIVSVYDRKQDAQNDLKKARYKYNERTDLYLLKDSGSWYRIEKINKNVLPYEEMGEMGQVLYRGL